MANNVAVIGIFSVLLVTAVFDESGANNKELIRMSFQAAIEEIRKVLANSATIQDLNKDDNNKAALKVCKEVLDLSIADLQLSFDKLGGYEMSKIGDYILNLRVWLSGALTTLQTCVDSYAEASILARLGLNVSSCLTMDLSGWATLRGDYFKQNQQI
ncbi:hypothetical protein GOBAR_AA03765 [Gossypium barbadense]|uniref:Pectinesterase inhibitor domain-containing protein n=1 Tax=Gossypium barbadense TaxID=3634 RepID=A0A2P5YMD6_GOSBA|nr:hypothetical protein GOBAR_AA03765 [Gossypium barbadense]